jgi:hypothetical protein
MSTDGKKAGETTKGKDADSYTVFLFIFGFFPSFLLFAWWSQLLFLVRIYLFIFHEDDVRRGAQI